MKKGVSNVKMNWKKSGILLLLIMVVSMLTACGGEQTAKEPADKVLKSNTVYTVAGEEPFAGGVAVKGNQILAVGTMEELASYIGDQTEVLDFGDQMIMPGLVDGHTHNDSNDTVLGVDLTFVKSRELASEKIKAFVAEHPDKTFITGGGWYAAEWGGDDPHKSFIDQVVKDIPVVLHDFDHHAMWCNSKALEMAGITKEYAAQFNQSTPGSLITVDENGEPTGYLRESGRTKMEAIIPDYTTDDIQYCIDTWSTLGVTAVNTMTPFMADTLILDQLEELEGRGDIHVRQVLSGSPKLTDGEIETLKSRFDSDIVRFGSIKCLLDGVGATYTASMLKPYVDTDNTGGEPYYTKEEIAEIVERASTFDLACHFHVCGDKAVRTALDGIELAKANGAKVDLRTSVDHMDTTHPDDINRAAALGISCNLTPDFMAPTPTWDTNPYLMIYDDAVKKELWNIGSLYRSGANVTFGTDDHTSNFVPYVQMYRATERVMDDGLPAGGYLPEEKVSRQEAVQCYTINAAKSLGMGDKIGTLEANKYADIIVLDRNILTCSPEALRETAVIMTMMNGEIVYEK